MSDAPPARVPPLLLLAREALDKAMAADAQELRRQHAEDERVELRRERERLAEERQPVQNKRMEAEAEVERAKQLLRQREADLARCREEERSVNIACERQYLNTRTSLRGAHERHIQSEMERAGYVSAKADVGCSVDVLKASGWCKCVGPLDDKQDDTHACGTWFFTRGRVHHHSKVLPLKPSMFCLCADRNDLCDACLPRRESTCGLCNEDFCSNCITAHHKPCYDEARRFMYCGLKWNEKRHKAGVLFELPHFVEGHCRRPLRNPDVGTVQGGMYCRCDAFFAECCAMPCQGVNANTGARCFGSTVCKECHEGQKALLDEAGKRVGKRKRPNVNPERVGMQRWKYVSCGPGCTPPRPTRPAARSS